MTENDLKAVFRNGNPADKESLKIMYKRKAGLEFLKEVKLGIRSGICFSVHIGIIR